MAKRKGWRNRITGHGEEAPDQLLANPKNWRIHPKHQQDALESVIDRVGFVSEVTVNKRTGYVVDGHLRVAMAISRGEPSVPVTYVDLSEEEEALVLTTLDPIAAMAGADKAQLEALLAGLAGEQDGVRALLDDMARDHGIQLGEPPVDPGAQMDRAEELQRKWGTERGQVWVVGDHRVMCGDSTCEADVTVLWAGETIDAVVTDPPYGVGTTYEKFEDTEANVCALIAGFMPTLEGISPIALTPGIPAMWFYPRPSWLLAWVHPAPSGSSPWGFAGLNPILVYGDDPYLKVGMGRRPDSLVMAADREGMDGHPTPKPIKVWEWLVERMTPESGQLVYDPFLGSGTTLVACEQLGRRGFGMEISPAYVAVSLERLAGLGLTPELANSQT